MCAAVDCLALVLQQHHNLEGCSRSRADVDSVGKAEAGPRGGSPFLVRGHAGDLIKDQAATTDPAVR